MAKTYYCAACLNSFTRDGATCPNLGCGRPRPDGGWGRLLAAGDLLDRRYRVRERLAVGGAGITYRAREVDDHDEEVGPELAIKVLFQRGDGTWMRRLANEARVLKELAHPHIIASRGFVERAGHPAYLVTVFEAGGNLFDHVQASGPLTLPQSISVFRQLLEALGVAHARGVIHRDLKPQNLLLRHPLAAGREPHILVADFGIAKLQGFLGDHLTTAGSFVGTPEFAAPEQYRGLPPEPAADVFAAGAILWFCLTGRTPVAFRDRTDLVACLKQLRAALPPRLPADVHVEDAHRADVRLLLDGTMALAAAERWSVRRALEAVRAIGEASTAATPLAEAAMGTLAPDALMELLGTLDEPIAAPAPAPPQAAPPADATAAPPPTTPPQPEPAAPTPATAEPRPGRFRLDDRPAARTAAPTPSTRPAPAGLDALFDTPADDASGVRQAEVSDDPGAALSLDDLFAPPPVVAAAPAPPPPRPATSPAPQPSSVLDATWETVVDAAPAVPGPSAPEADAPAWEPAAPQVIHSADDDRARLRAAGSCPSTQQRAWLEALEHPTAAVRAAASDADPAVLCGAALAVAHHGLAPLASWCRQQLTHDTPDVRATAALGLGAVGAAGQLAQLARLLDDPEAAVRLGAVHALRELGARTGRESLTRDWLRRCSEDPDPRVRAAARHP